MVTARMKFAKGEEVKYISHLDLQRTFQRALRRANISVAYSQGFNPHPKISFAMALAVGMTSEGEYIDVELNHPMDPDVLKMRLNHTLPKGLAIRNSRISENKHPSLMSVIRKGIYRIRIQWAKKMDPVDMERLIGDFLNEDEILMEKTNKKGKRIVKNIRPFIDEITLMHWDANGMELSMILGAGSQNNLKPELVVEKLMHHNRELDQEYSVRVHRKELLAEGGNSPIKNFG